MEPLDKLTMMVLVDKTQETALQVCANKSVELRKGITIAFDVMQEVLKSKEFDSKFKQIKAVVESDLNMLMNNNN